MIENGMSRWKADTTALSEIDEKTMIPDLLRAAPQTRRVLDRYGLRGCGGEYGPMESLGFFARAHDVPLDRLLGELRGALSQVEISAESAEQDAVADTIYRPFFKSGIAIVLSLGAVWGAYLLLRIGFWRSFTAVGIHEVNAHGHAQILGWVGLFVMGFAYQAFPRFKHTTLVHPRLALATLWMMLAGILARSGSQAFLAGRAWLLPVGVAGSALEIAAIALFVAVIGQTLARSGKPLAFHDFYILSSLGWFVVQAVYSAVYFVATALAPTRDALLDLVATWQAPLRDFQIHGFALLMILGVSQRLFHHFYGFPAPNPARGGALLPCLNVAVLGEAMGLVLMRSAGPRWAALWYGSVVVLAGSTAALVSGWRIYLKPAEHDRSLKFLRTAYAWLFVSLGMLALLPVHQFVLLPRLSPQSQAVAIGFSHAYYGAVRHAITVGFISLMIVGVAAKVVPTLKGVDVHGLRPLWLPYLLLNAGCAMRVGFQILTDFTGTAFVFAGVSGLLEVSGLAVWGVHLWGVMNGWIRERPGAAEVPLRTTPVQTGGPIVAGNSVGDVLAVYPGLLETFLEFGFKPLVNPVARRTLARRVTIETAARALGANLANLLAALNARVAAVR